MKQGKRTPSVVRKFILDTKRNAPGLSARQIVDRVVGRFGEDAGLDKSTVTSIIRGAGSGRGSESSSTAIGKAMSRAYEPGDGHLTKIRWLATQVLNQMTWDLVQLAGENPDNVHRHLAAAAGRTSESGLLINTRTRPTSVSLVVEKHPAFSFLLDHLSSVVPLREAPDNWDKAVSRTQGLAQESDPKAAVRVNRMPVPVSSFWYSLEAWKTGLSEAADLIRVVSEDLLEFLWDQGERLMDPEEVSSVEKEILPRFTDVSVAEVCGGLFPRCDAGQIRDGEYVLVARKHSVSGESLIELGWETPQKRSYALAISPSRDRIDELQTLHLSQQVVSEGHPRMVKLVQSLKQADLLERRMRDAVESALAARVFPGRCQQCPARGRGRPTRLARRSARSAGPSRI